MATSKVSGAAAYGLIESPHTTQTSGIAAYGLTQDPPQVSLRRTDTYILTSVPDQVQIKKVAVYQLSAPSVYPNFALEPKDWLLSLINKEFGTSYSLGVLSFSDVHPAQEPRHNSSFKIKAEQGIPYSGSMRMFYNRWKLEDAFHDQDVVGFVPKTGTTHSNLSAINAAFGINLKAEEIVDAPVSSSDGSLKLKATNGGLRFINGSEVILGASGPNLGRDIRVAQLSGWQRPQ